MNKKIVFSRNARQLLGHGVERLADAVSATLGPFGRNVIIEQEMGLPHSTKDGVTVAKSINFKDKLHNLGAQLVKQASIQTAEQAGDGTTTATLLAGKLYARGLEVTDAPNPISVVELKKGMDQAVSDVVAYLKTDLSRKVSNEAELAQVATISANNDESVGNLISTAIGNVGREGVITIEESKTGETYLETVEGIQFNRGYKSPYFVTHNNTMQTILQDVYVLITDKRLSAVKELLPALEIASTQNKSLLIIADDIEGETLSTLVLNKMRGVLKVVAVKAPDFGDRKKALLEDIAILTGGTVISEEKGMKLERFDLKWFGKAKKVTVSKDVTTIVDAQGESDKIIQRVEDIKQLIADTSSPYEKETLQDRLSKFIGGVAVVYVGGHSELEMKEKKDRVEDALHATRAALEEGLLPGGGKALINAHRYLQEVPKSIVDKSIRTGYEIVLGTLLEPFGKILKNAGKNPSDILLLEGMDQPWNSYDPRKEKVVDMYEEGIIDPTKVVRLALENAASVAGIMLLTDAVVVNEDEEVKKETPEMDFGMSDYGM